MSTSAAQQKSNENGEYSILDSIIAETRLTPDDEAYGIAKRGVSAFIEELRGLRHGVLVWHQVPRPEHRQQQRDDGRRQPDRPTIGKYHDAAVLQQTVEDWTAIRRTAIWCWP